MRFYYLMISGSHSFKCTYCELLWSTLSTRCNVTWMHLTSYEVQPWWSHFRSGRKLTWTWTQMPWWWAIIMWHKEILFEWSLHFNLSVLWSPFSSYCVPRHCYLNTKTLLLKQICANFLDMHISVWKTFFIMSYTKHSHPQYPHTYDFHYCGWLDVLRTVCSCTNSCYLHLLVGKRALLSFVQRIWRPRGLINENKWKHLW